MSTAVLTSRLELSSVADYVWSAKTQDGSFSNQCNVVTFWGSRGMGSFFSLRNIADSKEVQSVQNFGERQV